MLCNSSSSSSSCRACTCCRSGGDPPPPPPPCPTRPPLRTSWDELCAHPFWGALRPQPAALPDQPAWEALAQLAQQQQGGVGTAEGGSMSRSRSGSLGGGEAADGEWGEGEGGPEQPAAPTPLHPRAAARLQAGPVPPEIVAATAAKGAAAAAPQFAAFGGAAGGGSGLGTQPTPVAGGGDGGGSKRGQAAAVAAAAQGDASPADLSSGGTPPSLQQLVWHPTDGVMKPIVGNRRIERQADAAPDLSLLPFRPPVRRAGCVCLWGGGGWGGGNPAPPSSGCLALQCTCTHHPSAHSPRADHPGVCGSARRRASAAPVPAGRLGGWER